MSPRISWEGVFPAVTTQFNDDLSLNIDATAKVMDGLIRDGVSGLIVCGSVGENTSLERKEKIAIMETAKSVAAGRVPVLCGIAEFTTAFAVETAKEAARVGIDGVMVMPALVYSSKPHETAAHFRCGRNSDRSAGHALQQPADLQERRDAGHSGHAGRRRDGGVLQGFFRRHAALHRHPQHGRRPFCSFRRP